MRQHTSFIIRLEKFSRWEKVQKIIYKYPPAILFMKKLFILSLLACFIFSSIIAFAETNMGDESKSKMISDNSMEQSQAASEQEAALKAKGEEVEKKCIRRSCQMQLRFSRR